MSRWAKQKRGFCKHCRTRTAQVLPHDTKQGWLCARCGKSVPRPGSSLAYIPAKPGESTALRDTRGRR